MATQVVSYKSFIHKIQKSATPDIGRNNAASNTLNNLLLALVNRFAEVIHILANESNPNKVVSTISDKVVVAAAKILLPGELSLFALQEADRALDLLSKSQEEKHDNKIGTAERAGLILPPPRVLHQLRSFFGKRHIAKTVPVALAAVLQFVISEVLSSAGALAVLDKKKRVTPFNILTAINKDVELKEVFKTFLVGGGVTPYDYASFKSNEEPQAEEEEDDSYLENE